MRGCGVPFLLLSNFILPGNLKQRDFFKQKPAYSRRERREEYCLTRAVARRYPTDRTTTNKRVLGRKIRRGRDSPCINFLTEILPGPALAGASLSAYGLKLTQRCGLQIPTQHQAVGVAPLSRKSKTPLTRGFRFPRRGRPFAFRRVAPHFIPVNYFSKTRYAFWALYRISVQCHSKSGKIHYPLLFPKFYVCR